MSEAAQRTGTVSAIASDSSAEPSETIADLRRQLAAREAELRDRDERHERIIGAVAEGIYEWDIERDLLWPSPRLIDIFGFHGRELTAADWNELVHPDDFPRYRAALRDCLRGLTPRLDCEYRVRHGNAAYRWIEDRAVPVRNAAGRAMRLTGAITDVTARKATEQALRDNEERYSLVSQAVAEGIYDWNVERNTLFVSPRLMEIFSFEGHGLSSEDWFALVHADDREQYRSAIRNCFRGESPKVACEYRILVRSGGYRWVEDHGLPIRDSAGRAVRLVGAVSDITARKESDHALRERTAALQESLEYQTATSNVLQVISRSTFDLEPVFETIVATAARLCNAQTAFISSLEKGAVRIRATYAVSPEFQSFIGRRRLPLSRENVAGRTALEGRVVQVPDIANDPEFNLPESVTIGKLRTVLGVPLLRDGNVIGVITLGREWVEPFTERQIELVRTFADQAVIAVENVRLLNELRERTNDLQEMLEYQTAASEVLNVISRSTFDLQPVLATLIQTAARLCDAEMAWISRRDGEVFRYVASSGATPEGAADAAHFQKTFLDTNPIPAMPGRRTMTARVLSDRQSLQIADITADTDYDFPETIEIANIRTLLGVPLLREEEPVGMIMLARQRVLPFTERQIELVRTFANHAVIAIENTRLLTEIREALDQQTATAEVLQVINSSPGDLMPVFDAMLEKAMRLCEADFGLFLAHEGERLREVATRGVPQAYVEFMRDNPHEFVPQSGPGRVLAGERLVQYVDLKDTDLYRDGNPIRRAIVDLAGARSMVLVPLLKDDTVRGIIVIFRQEPRPFADKQISLLQNFAAQAVIAMENARLLGELRESLQRYSLVTQAVGEGVYEWNIVNDSVTTSPRLLEIFGLEPVDFTTPGDWRRLVHPEDVPAYRAAIRECLRGQGERLHCEYRFRHAGGEYRWIADSALPIRDEQGKAVRLIGAVSDITERKKSEAEIREALEQQTATAEVLQVINSSPGDLAPVFEAMLEKAHRLCGVGRGALLTFDGEFAQAVATHGIAEPQAGLLRQPFRPLLTNSPHARVAREKRVIHIPDLAADELWERNDPKRIGATQAGVGTMLFVPLRKDESVLGWISANRLEVRPFTEKEITLLQNFAAQAVIAMENARLLGELRDRQAELRVTFDNMGDGVAMFDAGLRLAAWNANFQRLLDLPDELLAQRPTSADYVRYLAEHGEYGAVDVEAEVRRLTNVVGTQWATERIRPDGRIIEVRHNPVPGGGFVLIYSDVTERKRAESDIRAARDAAEKALEELRTAQASLLHAQKMAALGQLTAGIAHEIKNPLNFVNNFAGLSVELLDELQAAAAPGIATLHDDTRAEIEETVEMLTSNLEKIAEHGRRADGIVKSMLAHSRGTSGDRQRVDINALVEEALNLAYHGARAQDQNFNITLERDFDAAAAPLELVPQDVTRVFLNLIGNGFYAAHKRKQRGVGTAFRPTLTVTTHDFGDTVEVRVRDNGTGIPPELRDKLFQPFFTTKPTGEGTGLGLSISYDIVTQQHGGTIAVDSEVGEFTEFTVRLPRSTPITGERV